MPATEQTAGTTISEAGTARLAIVVPVAVISFFYASILEYALPLYFGALGAAAEKVGVSYPTEIWSELVKYQVTPWIVGPVLAGLLARRYGERVVWSGALIGKVFVPLALAVSPDPTTIKIIAVWQGFTGAMMWIAGISLVQMVVPSKKARSNALLMTALGIGSLFGPVVGRFLLYRGPLGPLVSQQEWSLLGGKLLALEPLTAPPRVEEFYLIFWVLMVSTLVCGVVVGLWGQRPGKFTRDKTDDWKSTWKDLSELVSETRFWALVIALAVLGGPVFQASNQFLPYRAEEMGLKSGAADEGWIWLQLLKTLMWIPGGLAIGLLAGRRVVGLFAVGILGAFSVAALSIGLSDTSWMLFASVACFEFVRQFMRWSHAGYMSEHMPTRLRATAIGCTITFSGLGSTIYAWLAALWWSPQEADFHAADPFMAAFVLGALGAIGLFCFDRIVPIRRAVNETQ